MFCVKVMICSDVLCKSDDIICKSNDVILMLREFQLRTFLIDIDYLLMTLAKD